MSDVDVLDDPRFLALWAKSDSGGLPHSLVGHLLDTAAVAEIIWDEFLSTAFRRKLNEAAGGAGRALYVMLSALHDLGKATPAFQGQVPALAEVASRAGWVGASYTTGSHRPHHTDTGGALFRKLLRSDNIHGLDWAIQIIRGHHGRFAQERVVERAMGIREGWLPLQLELARGVTRAAQAEPAHLSMVGGSPPSLGTQIALAGYVTMADWIASSSEFAGKGSAPCSMDHARSRAQRAWRNLGFGSGWRPSKAAWNELYAQRFDQMPRPLQRLVGELSGQLSEPGLAIIEAPMGEGKTEAGLMLAESWAARLGLDGVILALPTQGTTDAMYQRFLAWRSTMDQPFDTALLHGKSMVNDTWRRARRSLRQMSGDEFGMADDLYGNVGETCEQERDVPPQWVLGRHRALLSHGAVATVDQVLLAGANIKYASVRHAGLSGKVLIIDEVHSYDIYMSQFLLELVGWAAAAGIPVILMSATLPAQQRLALVRAYQRGLSGALTDPAVEDIDLERVEVTGSAQDGYPLVTVIDNSGTRDRNCKPFRDDQEVKLTVTGDLDDLAPLADRLRETTASGGVALVILNVIERAQTLFTALKERGVPTVLLTGASPQVAAQTLQQT